MDAVDTGTLLDAQRALLGTAVGDFPAPESAEDWPAELVLAHVIATQRSFTTLGGELLLGSDVAYDNRIAVSRPYLEAIATARGDLETLRDELRRSSAELVAVAGRVAASRATMPFPCRIHDGGTVVVDGPMSYAGLLEGHARDHLPLHARQLDTLRAL